MTTLAARGSGTPVTNGTTWASATNAVDGAAGTNPATYATWTNAVASGGGYIEIGGYNFSATIGAGDTLNSVTVSLRHFENNTGRFVSVRFQPYDGSTAIGTLQTATLATAARNDAFTFPVTLAQLRSANFKVRVTVLGAGSTQSRVFSIDYADVTADYTGPTPQTWSGSTGEVGVAGITGTFVETVPLPADTRATESDSQLVTEGADARATEAFVTVIPPQTWSGSVGSVGAAGESSAFVASGTAVWSGSTATIGAAGITAAFVPGPFSWIGSIATIGAAGTSGAFVTGTAAWAGSTATIGVAGITDSFVAGTAAWSGSTAAVGVEGVSGAFTGAAPPPQIWVTPPTIDDTYSGPAGTALTAYTPPYVSDGYYPMLSLDGAGNAVTDGGTIGGATHTVALPTDCWAEWVISIPNLTPSTSIVGQIKMPGLAWYHGYDINLTVAGGNSDLALLRDDVFDAARSVEATIVAGADHAIRIEARGANFKLFLDGVEKLDWTDPAPLSGGLVGPYTGVSIYTDDSPADAVKLRSYRGGAHVGASLMAVGVSGMSGAFSESAIPPQTWSGTTATIGVAGITGSFTAGAATWSGSIAAVGVEGVTGVFVSLSFPQTWSGSTATIGVAGISVAFFEQPLPAGTRVLESDHPARIFEDGVYRTFESGVVVNIWNGSDGTIGVAGVSGSFVASGTVAWSGTVATIGAAGITGAFSAGSAPQTWNGSVASVGALGVSGAFVTGVAAWQGSTASVGVEGITGAFAGGAAAWTGSTATVGVAGQSALFINVAMELGARFLESGLARQLEGAIIRNLESGTQVWGGSPATIGVGGVTGAFVETEIPQVWGGSVASLGVFAVEYPFGVEAFAWEGSGGRIGVEATSGEFTEADIPQVWFGSVASIGVTGTSLEWNADYFVYGMWNGQYVVGMMYNAAEIVEVALT